MGIKIQERLAAITEYFISIASLFFLKAICCLSPILDGLTNNFLSFDPSMQCKSLPTVITNFLP